MLDRRGCVRDEQGPGDEFEVEAKTWSLDHRSTVGRSIAWADVRSGEPPALIAGDDLLRPREVARLFGVRPTTIARWARDGKLRPVLTPGGHRRYLRSEMEALLGSAGNAELDQVQESLERDAVRLYQQGWTIRQVAARFSLS